MKCIFILLLMMFAGCSNHLGNDVKYYVQSINVYRTDSCDYNIIGISNRRIAFRKEEESVRFYEYQIFDKIGKYNVGDTLYLNKTR